MKTWLKVAIPLLILVLGAVAASAVVEMRETPPKTAPVILPPLVRVETVHASELTLEVRAQGTVRPRTESAIAAEVAGRVLRVAPAFADGGFFAPGDVLVEIDPADYRQALAAARARVTQAELRLAQEEAAAAVARREWESLGADGEASPLTLRTLQVKDAAAALEAARADVERAERDLERTRVVAPFAGRVRTKMADVGHFVNRGTALAEIYATDVFEVGLPVPDRDLAFVDVPLVGRGSGPTVRLEAEFAGRRHAWQGRIVRTEGEVDARSRVVTLVAEVRDPFGSGRDASRLPLAPGMFVDGIIGGRTLPRAFTVPRAAFRGDDVVMVVDAENRLRLRKVAVHQTGRDASIVTEGLEDGDRVSVTALDSVTDGMAVRVADAAPSGS